MKKTVVDDLLTTKETASFLKVSSSWLSKARISGDGPRFIKMGRSVRYSLQALEEFKRANARGSTSEYECCPGPGRPVRGNARTLIRAHPSSCTKTAASWMTLRAYRPATGRGGRLT